MTVNSVRFNNHQKIIEQPWIVELYRVDNHNCSYTIASVSYVFLLFKSGDILLDADYTIRRVDLVVTDTGRIKRRNND